MPKSSAGTSGRFEEDGAFTPGEPSKDDDGSKPIPATGPAGICAFPRRGLGKEVRTLGRRGREGRGRAGTSGGQGQK